MPKNTELSDGVLDGPQIDSWEAAFVALEQKDEEGAEETPSADGGSPGADTTGSGGADAVSDTPETGDSDEPEDDLGGSGADVGGDDEEDGDASGDVPPITDKLVQELQESRQEHDAQIQNQVIETVAEEFIKQGVRSSNGALGATINDPDICKRDEDGVPRFYNPETGREFTGDNPRRQAQEWVDDYNRELARVFNNACGEYEQHLRQEEEPMWRTVEFAPRYRRLDPIRRGMLDTVLEDYEVKDPQSGDVIGYSCDLDKALALVDRQVSMIQGYAKAHAQKEPPSGPVLDMKTSSGAVRPSTGDKGAPTSLAEALEIMQDNQLERLRNGKK
jgi:hypothetical protein